VFSRTRLHLAADYANSCRFRVVVLIQIKRPPPVAASLKLDRTRLPRWQNTRRELIDSATTDEYSSTRAQAP
jgi:hypothetical protein